MLLAALACAEEGAEEADDAAADTTAVEPAAGISLANLAGTWNVRVMPMDSDTTLVESQITVDEAGWTMLLPDREPIPGNVMVEGDSVTVDAGPFESVLRDGVMVTTRTVYRMEGDRLMGMMTARYESTGADSVAHLRLEGTRAP